MQYQTMPFSKVYTKNMDLSYFTIGARCHMVPDPILYLIATWPSANIFSQDQKWISLKISSFIFKVSLAKFLWRLKKVHFSFFTYSRLLAMAFSFLHILNFNNIVDDKFPKDSMFNWCSNGLLSLYKHLLWCTYNLLDTYNLRNILPQPLI